MLIVHSLDDRDAVIESRRGNRLAALAALIVAVLPVTAARAFTVFVDLFVFVCGADLTGVTFSGGLGSSSTAAGATEFVAQDRMGAVESGGALVSFDWTSALFSTNPAETPFNLALIFNLSGDAGAVSSVTPENLVLQTGPTVPTGVVLPSQFVPSGVPLAVPIGGFSVGGAEFVSLVAIEGFTTLQATPIPLPPAITLLIGGIGALGAIAVCRPRAKA